MLSRRPLERSSYIVRLQKYNVRQIKWSIIDALRYNPDNLPRKLNDVIQLLILQLALDRPGIILREIQDEVMEVAGVMIAHTIFFWEPVLENCTR